MTCCADCGVPEKRNEAGHSNISPFSLCVACHIARAKAVKAIPHAEPPQYDWKLDQAGERDE